MTDYTDLDGKIIVIEKDIEEILKEEIKKFIEKQCEKKEEGLSNYLCKFDKTHNISNANAYILNSEFFQNASILGQGFFGIVYDSGLWTIDNESDTVQDIIVKTQKLSQKTNIFEAYINLVLINQIIMENKDIGLVPTFGIFYCGRKLSYKYSDGVKIQKNLYCKHSDGTQIYENNDIFIVQEKKYAKNLSDTKIFTVEMLHKLFGILIILEKNGIYHNDINVGNILVDKNGNIYLIDFGLASFMFNDKRYNSRHEYGKITAFNDFYSICTILSVFNNNLYVKIYPVLESIINKFSSYGKRIDINDVGERPFSFYLETIEDGNHFQYLKIYSEYTIEKIYEEIKRVLD